MRNIILVLLVLIAVDAQAMGSSKKKSSGGVVKWLEQQRIDAVQDMAPKIGLDPAKILKSRVEFKTCEHNGTQKDFGPWVDGALSTCSELPKGQQAHAWCMSNARIGWVKYMFAIIGKASDVAKGIVVKCVRHEVCHELLDWYGIGGHPTKVTIVRKDNGKEQTFKPAQIIGGRWPSLRDVFVPESMESQEDWADVKCGSEGVMHGDGEGI